MVNGTKLESALRRWDKEDVRRKAEAEREGQRDRKAARLAKPLEIPVLVGLVALIAIAYVAASIYMDREVRMRVLGPILSGLAIPAIRYAMILRDEKRQPK